MKNILTKISALKVTLSIIYNRCN